MKTYSVKVHNSYYCATAAPNGATYPTVSIVEALVNRVLATWERESCEARAGTCAILTSSTSSECKDRMLERIMEEEENLSNKYGGEWYILPVEGAVDYTIPPLDGWSIKL